VHVAATGAIRPLLGTSGSYEGRLAESPLRAAAGDLSTCACCSSLRDIIGAVAGLLGIGGGELRLPVLVSFLALSVKLAITVNLAISVATLGTSLIRRWDSGALDDIGGWGLLVVAVLEGNIVGALLGVRSGHRAREPKLARAMQLYLVAIGLLFIYEALFHFPHLDVSRDAPPALVLAGLCGRAVGWVASVFGVAGGELRIPVLIYVFGAPIKVAGTLSTIAALPAVALAFTGYAIRGHVRSLSGYSLILLLGASSVVGVTVGVALLPSISDSVLRLLLGSVLLACAARLRTTSTRKCDVATAA
jgi:uncharacterized membrane protein YfcA